MTPDRRSLWPLVPPGPLAGLVALVSIPNDQSSTAPVDVLATVAAEVERVMGWDTCAAAPGWQEPRSSDPTSVTLTSIDPTKGLWLKADPADTTLPSTGTVAESGAIPPCARRSLIGVPSAVPRHPRIALASIAGFAISANRISCGLDDWS